jgi:mRNA-degrading endonuclease RelE of RelBE toxin-antitoxin system
MIVEVRSTRLFDKQLKRLVQKYPLLFEDSVSLTAQIKQGQLPGDRIPNLVHEVYKVRVPNRSAKKGKSGGFRVIYYVKTGDLIGMLSIYVKTEQTDIPLSQITTLIEEFLSDQPNEE